MKEYITPKHDKSVYKRIFYNGFEWSGYDGFKQLHSFVKKTDKGWLELFCTDSDLFDTFKDGTTYFHTMAEKGE